MYNYFFPKPVTTKIIPGPSIDDKITTYSYNGKPIYMNILIDEINHESFTTTFYFDNLKITTGMLTIDYELPKVLDIEVGSKYREEIALKGLGKYMLCNTITFLIENNKLNKNSVLTLQSGYKRNVKLDKYYTNIGFNCNDSGLCSAKITDIKCSFGKYLTFLKDISYIKTI
jgi:hypothetical protein